MFEPKNPFKNKSEKVGSIKFLKMQFELQREFWFCGEYVFVKSYECEELSSNIKFTFYLSNGSAICATWI